LSLFNAHPAWVLACGACLVVLSAQADNYDQALQALASGDTQQAEQQLRLTLAHNPRHAGAWLDLALLYCDAGQQQAAFTIFDDIEHNFSPSVGIQALIAHYRQQGCTPITVVPDSKASTSLSYSLGTASNVNLAPSVSSINLVIDTMPQQLILQDSYRPKADSYQELTLYHQQPLAQGNWQFLLQARGYGQQTQQDSVYALAAWQPKPTWQLWLTQLQLGGIAYQTGVHLLAMHPLSNTFAPEVQLSRLTYPSVSGFDANQIEPRLRWHGALGQTQFELAPGYLFDGALDNRPGGNRAGATVQASVSSDGFAPWDMGARLRWQQQQDANSYGGLWSQTTRNNSYLRWQLWLGYRITAQQRLGIDYSAQQVRDNIDLFEYNNNTTSLVWQYNL
jgi:hypothetical protein